MTPWRAPTRPINCSSGSSTRIASPIRDRLTPPNSPQRVSWPNIKRGLTMLAKILWNVGVRGDSRREFWKFVWPRLKKGDIQRIISVGLVAHHLILFARGAASGKQTASYYSTRLPGAAVPAGVGTHIKAPAAG